MQLEIFDLNILFYVIKYGNCRRWSMITTINMAMESPLSICGTPDIKHPNASINAYTMKISSMRWSSGTWERYWLRCCWERINWKHWRRCSCSKDPPFLFRLWRYRRVLVVSSAHRSRRLCSTCCILIPRSGLDWLSCFRTSCWVLRWLATTRSTRRMCRMRR